MAANKDERREFGMRVLGAISRGGFGRVEKVLLEDGSIAARKILDPRPNIIEAAGEDKLRRRFKREVRVQSSLSPDYFIPVLACELDCEEPWFTMPLAERNFWEQIQEARASGTIPVEALADILNALEELHSLGYVHRDLKPQNILLHDGHWKLSDFGLVMPLTNVTTQLTSLNSSWGTEEYCAPEQAEDFRNATPSVDIYAFGCILHDLFVGTPRVPYRRHSSDGSVGLVIEKCTEESPRRRFKTIAALRGTLMRVLSEPQNPKPSLDASQWVGGLRNAKSWNSDTLDDFARFIKKTQNETDLWAIFAVLDEEGLGTLHQIDEELWNIVALAYCNWARHGAFDFNYCDVIVGRLQVIFDLGNLDIKSAAALAATSMGSSHNRWFVMHRLLQMCGPSLNNQVAQRIAIEICAEETQGDFIRCADVIGRSIESYHPAIAHVLVEFNNTRMTLQ